MENNINNIWKTDRIEYCGPSSDRYSFVKTEYKNNDFNVYFIVDRYNFLSKVTYIDIINPIDVINIPPEIIYNKRFYKIEWIMVKPLVKFEKRLNKLIINSEITRYFYTNIPINHVYIKNINKYFCTKSNIRDFVNSVYIGNYNLLLKNTGSQWKIIPGN